jgi:vitamin B12/bleomycin/antimicrobial peptide transport system ATP-binding/permease protein
MKKSIIILVTLLIVELALSLYLTEWRSAFWDDVSAKNMNGFTHQLIVFGVVALTLCFVSAYSTYVTFLLGVEWRKVLTERAVKKQYSNVENINQRIQEDCSLYPRLAIDLAIGIGKSLVYIVVFSAFLISQFKASYLIYIVLYSLLGTVIARKVARPLVILNYDSQRAEANYRMNLSLLNFEDCIRLMLGLAKKTKTYNYFQIFYGQMAVLVPLIIVAPDYFTGVMTIGMLMQVNSVMATILDNMSYGVSSFDGINKFISVKRRLNEIGDVL